MHCTAHSSEKFVIILGSFQNYSDIKISTGRVLKNIVRFEQWGLKFLKFCENIVKIFPEPYNKEPGIWKRNHGNREGDGDGISERRFQVIDLKKK